MAKKNKGIFYSPPKYEKYADIITFKSPTAAQRAASQLVAEAREAERPSKVRRILNVLNLAANRAKAGASNPKFKGKTKAKWRKIAKIYRNAVKRVSRIYERKKANA